MLVLERKAGEAIYIGDDIKIVVRSIIGAKVRLGIEAPREVQICRDDAITKQPKT